MDVDRLAGEEAVAAAVVEVRWVLTTMSMPARSKSCSLSGLETRIHVGHQRVQLGHAGVDQAHAIGMVDDVDVDRHPLALGEQIRQRGRA